MTYHPEEERDFQEMFDTIVNKAEKSRKIVALACDLRKEDICQELVKRHLEHHGRLDALYARLTSSHNDTCYVER